jgi:glycosyltransferase involved in cell wall biosynthesis
MVGKLDQKLDLLRGGMSRDSNKESVKYLGHVKSYNLALLLRQSEFIILPSYSEGQPICLLEAISLSRPFVASKLEGICSIDPSNSFSENCTPGSQKELKEAIYKMIQRIEMNEFNHKEIRRVWESNFSPEVQSRNLLKIFNSLIQSK